MTELQPQAAERSAGLDRIGVGRAVLAEALNGVADAVAVLNGLGQVLYQNPAAVRLFERCRSLIIGPDKVLQLADAAAAEQFARFLGADAVEEDELEHIAVRCPQSCAVLISLQPIPQTCAEMLGGCFIAWLKEQPEQMRALPSLLSNFRLTPAELRLVEALAAGQTLKQYAKDKQISYETARSHIRRVFEKFGVKRQAELVLAIMQMK